MITDRLRHHHTGLQPHRSRLTAWIATTWPAMVVGFGVAATIVWIGVLGWLLLKAVHSIL
jgi:hypothetical protein